MSDTKQSEKGFNDLLEGRPTAASPQLERMRKLAKALEPGTRPGANPQFRARLRNELLARATATDEDIFAALLDGMELDAPEPVKALVAVAAALEPASLPTPDPAFRYALRNRLLVEAERHAPMTRRARNRFVALNQRMRSSLRLVVSAGLAATLLAGAGATMAAAQNALPGDALYPVKLFRESAQLAVSSGADEGIKRLDFARTRLQEIRGLESRGNNNAAVYIATLDRMDTLTQTGATMIVDAVRHGAERSILSSVKGFTTVQEQDLVAILPTLPPGAQPAARDSLALLVLVNRTVGQVLANCPCNPPSNPLIPHATQSSPSVQCSCDQTGTSSQATGPGTGTSGSSQTGAGTPKTTSPSGPQAQPSTPIDQLPNVPGTQLDDQVKSLVDQLLTSPSPVPSVSVPPLPLPSPSLSLGL